MKKEILSQVLGTLDCSAPHSVRRSAFLSRDPKEVSLEKFKKR